MLVPGRDHLKTLTHLNNLGMVLQDAGRLDEAMAVLEEAPAGCEARLGPDHPDTLKSVNNLAFLLVDLDRPEEAREMFEGSLEGRTHVRGPERPDTIKATVNLGWFYDRQGRLDQAAALNRRAFDV